MIWKTLLQLRETLVQSPARRTISIVLPVGSDKGSDKGPDRGPDKDSPSTAAIDIDSTDAEGDIIITLGAEDNRVSGSAHECPANATTCAIKADRPFAISINPTEPRRSGLDAEALALLETYLPYALLPCFAVQHQRSFAISHFAQTLDGKIATREGDSRWIGNGDNLTHAHRMRALCDAILIGSNTLRRDQPQLTVRHVSGRNPRRIVVGQNAKPDQLDSDEPILQVIAHDEYNGANANNGDEHSLYVPSVNERIDCASLLTALYHRGIHSVYIEGGASTTSSFLQQGALDQVQVHIAPRIMGSGLTGFSLEPVDSMQQVMQFQHARFIPVGDEIMFLGEP